MATTPQTITSPSGDELVVIPRAEYDALMRGAIDAAEDAADIALIEERRADLASGRDVRLPPKVTAFMLDGDALLRALRKWKGITQAQLSRRANLAQGYISDLEKGRKAGTPATLREIAKALEVDPVWLGLA